MGVLILRAESVYDSYTVPNFIRQLVWMFSSRT